MKTLTNAPRQPLRRLLRTGALLATAMSLPALAAKPAILLEGMADQAIPPDRAIADFRGVWPDAPVVELPGVGHFCQEDAPEILVANITQFLQS